MKDFTLWLEASAGIQACMVVRAKSREEAIEKAKAEAKKADWMLGDLDLQDMEIKVEGERWSGTE